MAASIANGIDKEIPKTIERPPKPKPKPVPI